MPPPAEQDQRSNGVGIFAAVESSLQQINIAVIRLDGKMDNLNQRFSDFKDSVNTELKGIRETQRDQESRLRMLQDRDYVAPATVWKVVGALISVFGIITTIVIAVVNSKP